jgi:hypothetical protein
MRRAAARLSCSLQGPSGFTLVNVIPYSDWKHSVPVSRTLGKVTSVPSSRTAPDCGREDHRL